MGLLRRDKGEETPLKTHTRQTHTPVLVILLQIYTDKHKQNNMMMHFLHLHVASAASVLAFRFLLSHQDGVDGEVRRGDSKLQWEILENPSRHDR